MSGSIIVLEGETSNVVLEMRGLAPPVWRWWGPRFDTATLPPPMADMRPPATFSLDVDQPLTVVPAFGGGLFGAPALCAHRGGRHFAQAFATESIERDGDTLTIILSDAAAQLSLIQRLALSGDVLNLSATVVNEAGEDLYLDWLSAGTLPLPADCAAIRSFTGRHASEFVPEEEKMPAFGWIRENRRGITGHAGPPGLFIMGPGATWHAGRVQAAQLAWSGNHRLAVERDDEGCWTLQMGEAFAPGEVRLKTGERYDTPRMIAACSTSGVNGAIQAFHAEVRKRLPWPSLGMRPRPVHVNSWEGFYFDHDEAALMRLADRSAALGIERFVLDDGWFAGREDDSAALGDWTPDPRKYPRGLAPLAEHVVSLGMEFGLWIEPEMVNPNSGLYRDHPDWTLVGRDRPLLTARNQLVLDLGRQEVREHLFKQIDALLSSLPITYLKWDHNRDLAPAVGADRAAAYRTQVLGAYCLLDRIRAKHPLLEIEACAGGGGRIDASMATRCHRFWTSDNMDAIARASMQRGFLHFLPPEVMGAHIGASPAHSTGRGQNMAFRAAVALPGHLGIELNPACLAVDDETELAAGIARYKALRDRLHSGRIWLGDSSDGIVWQAHGERGDLLLLVTRLAPTTLRRPPALPLPPLAGAGPQRVWLLHLAQAADRAVPSAPLLDAMVREGVTFDGDWLAQVGLPLPVMKAESVALFHVAAS